MDSITQIENSIEYAQAKVNLAKKLVDLYDNPVFNEVIVKGYMETEAIRLVGYYGSGRGTAEEKAEMERDMHGIGSFRAYLSKIISEGQQAENDLQMHKEMREEMLRERAETAARQEQLPLDIDPDYAGSLGA